ncbi:hypothetical protein [Mariprofundus ferrooxydans]|uniref:hypothetical protein n=1 Tax=Mariprofundus ferrooxydans TaxID=314344 RepID=UPI0014319A4E|nr:hypothetical protein [Mariprofundus ferrooxydans]
MKQQQMDQDDIKTITERIQEIVRKILEAVENFVRALFGRAPVGQGAGVASGAGQGYQMSDDQHEAFERMRHEARLNTEQQNRENMDAGRQHGAEQQSPANEEDVQRQRAERRQAAQKAAQRAADQHGKPEPEPAQQAQQQDVKQQAKPQAKPAPQPQWAKAPAKKVDKLQNGIKLLNAWADDRLKADPKDDLGRVMKEEADVFKKMAERDQAGTQQALNERLKEFEKIADDIERDKQSEQKSTIAQVLDGDMTVNELGNDMAANMPAQGMEVAAAPVMSM